MISRGMDHTLRRERVLKKLSTGLNASSVLLEYLEERIGKKFEVENLWQWGFLKKDRDVGD